MYVIYAAARILCTAKNRVLVFMHIRSYVHVFSFSSCVFVSIKLPLCDSTGCGEVSEEGWKEAAVHSRPQVCVCVCIYCAVRTYM